MELLSKQGISEERIKNAPENLKMIKRLLCGICLDILWKPICCSKCQMNFCEVCMNKWIDSKTYGGPTCPNRCRYTKANTPPIVLDLLSDFKITCCHKEYGCNEILSYDQLEKHEAACCFQPKECGGCKMLVPKCRLGEHEDDCELIERNCEGCNTNLTRKEFRTHDHTGCLKNILDKKEVEILLINMVCEQQMQEQSKKLKEVQNEIEIMSGIIKQKSEETAQVKMSYEGKLKEQEKQIKSLQEEILALQQGAHVTREKWVPFRPAYMNSTCAHDWSAVSRAHASPCSHCSKIYLGGMYRCGRCSRYSCDTCKL